MNIGEKIRELRVAKLMTQAELAGTHITRNMLSCIENGTAQPSLSTILYIAKRLNVPAGFLLAEAGDELLYRKMNSLGNIKHAYAAGDLYGCRSLCLSGCPEPDDEICLLLAECDAGIAEEEFHLGRLRSACRFFDEALSYAERTLYPTATVEARAGVYFRYMRRISPTLYSDVLDEEKLPPLSWQSPLSTYTVALEQMDDGEWTQAKKTRAALEDGSFYATHLDAAALMHEGNYREAKRTLTALLNAEDPLEPISLYTVLSELEICCRETEDYKGAYGYSTDKVQLLEQLLKEV